MKPCRTRANARAGISARLSSAELYSAFCVSLGFSTVYPVIVLAHAMTRLLKNVTNRSSLRFAAVGVKFDAIKPTEILVDSGCRQIAVGFVACV